MTALAQQFQGRLAQNFKIPDFTTSLPANQKSYELLIPSKPGTHNVEVRLDTDNLNAEALENDNSKTGSITVP